MTCRGQEHRWTLAQWIRMLAAILIVSGFGVPPASAQTGSPGASEVLEVTTAVFATGPFGRVAGSGLATGSQPPDPATMDVLNAYGRGATVTFTPSTGVFDGWRMTATQEAVNSGEQSPVEMDTGETDSRIIIAFPSTGLFLVRLMAGVTDPTSPDAPLEGSWAWRIAVPDRDMPPDGPPAPAIMLTSGDETVALDLGSGCFVGTCGDIGATPPPRTLPTIHSVAGAPLTARLADGSGFTEWTIEATPVNGGNEQTVTLDRGSAESSAHELTFTAPAAGRWVILVHVLFDRDRGSFDGYGRLILGTHPTGSIDPART